MAVPPFIGAVSLAGATLVSEDLACVAAGVLVAEGQLPFLLAVAACMAGIVGGDVALMLIGRALGPKALGQPLIRSVTNAESLDRMSRWLNDRGAIVVALSRFVPGTRLATYLAAGTLGMKASTFVRYATLSALLWVPALIALTAVAGREAVASGLVSSGTAIALAMSIAAAVGLAIRAIRTYPRPAWRTRRRLYGFWQRCTRWEFWPAWLFYAPLVASLLPLAIKHRGLTVFSAANPGIPAGGFIGESKFEILRALAPSGRVARAALLPAAAPLETRLSMALAFMQRSAIDFPIVVKPDQGQRGSGVAVVRTAEQLAATIAERGGDSIVQEYVQGLEFGVFYYRRPSESRGRIFSITHKRFPSVRGDGIRTLDELILGDDRAVCLEHVHRRAHQARLANVPESGAIVPLVEIGSHCRGALFVDASHLRTAALADAFDDVARPVEGFHIGRFDVRTRSIDDFARRGIFTVLELNGVTSEATHIYDPATSLRTAYRVLRAQWRLAFEIGAENLRRGATLSSPRELVTLIGQYRKMSRPHGTQALL